MLTSWNNHPLSVIYLFLVIHSDISISSGDRCSRTTCIWRFWRAGSLNCHLPALAGQWDNAHESLLSSCGCLARARDWTHILKPCLLILRDKCPKCPKNNSNAPLTGSFYKAFNSHKVFIPLVSLKLVRTVRPRMDFGAGMDFLLWKLPLGSSDCWGVLGFQKQHPWRGSRESPRLGASVGLRIPRPPPSGSMISGTLLQFWDCPPQVGMNGGSGQSFKRDVL